MQIRERHVVNETLIEIEHLSKKYCRDLKSSMLYGLQDLALDLVDLDGKHAELRKNEFWALQDISLCLKRGEVLGVLGANGAGKSTLLKLISGIFYPDCGSVRTRGKIGEMIEVGAGFHPMLTGRENIYVKGAILGLGRKQIETIFDEIVDFAELGEFIDTPVKYYSSGMHMRLGFAIIAHSGTDILLIDEVLSVGDVSFRAKCFNKINELISDTGVVFVSHNMADVARISTSVLLLNRGQSRFYDSDVMGGINHYYEDNIANNTPVLSGSGNAHLQSVSISSGIVKNSMTIQDQMDDLVVLMSLTADINYPNLEVVVTITSLEQQNLVQSNSCFDEFELPNGSGQINLQVNMGKVCLVPAVYGMTISIHAEKRGRILAKYSNCLLFRITGKRLGHASIQAPAQWSLI